MKSIRVELAFGPETIGPLHERLCASPDLEREVILGGQAVDGVETITSFVEGDPDAYEPVLAELDPVLEYDLTPSGGGFFVYLRRELGPNGASLLDALAQETVVVVPPIEVRPDRTMRLTVAGHPADLGSVVEDVPEGIDVDVLRVRSDLAVDGESISDRQREALEAAREVGFYEVPRRNGVEAVADELDCAVSTASELVRRGEARAVDRVLESSR